MWGSIGQRPTKKASAAWNCGRHFSASATPR
jgi:hypothetical protein